MPETLERSIPITGEFTFPDAFRPITEGTGLPVVGPCPPYESQVTLDIRERSVPQTLDLLCKPRGGWTLVDGLIVVLPRLPTDRTWMQGVLTTRAELTVAAGRLLDSLGPSAYRALLAGEAVPLRTLSPKHHGLLLSMVLMADSRHALRERVGLGDLRLVFAPAIRPAGSSVLPRTLCGGDDGAEGPGQPTPPQADVVHGDPASIVGDAPPGKLPNTDPEPSTPEPPSDALVRELAPAGAWRPPEACFTLSHLVEALSAAGPVEWHVDRRLADQLLFTTGATLPWGGLLKAACLATGTGIRRVGKAAMFVPADAASLAAPDAAPPKLSTADPYVELDRLLPGTCGGPPAGGLLGATGDEVRRHA
ncbi:MAG: hypothetical protein FJX74_02585 [Armatimonadetes bacterium]|nr:hypothetical protein [Armatimonadota bacterium]